MTMNQFNSTYHDQEYDEKMIYLYQQIDQTRFYDASDDDEDTLIVPQRLSTEQYRFEFPSKSYLESLSYLDNIQDEYSFFDESSFTTSLTAYSPANTFENTQINSSHMVSDWHEMVDDDDELVDDGRLSPLQLPAQANPKTRIHSTDCKKRELSGESARTITQSERPVGPSSFLSDLHSNSNNMYSPVTQAYRLKNQSRLSFANSENEESNMGVFCNESVPIMDNDVDSTTSSSDSIRTTESRIVLVKLFKSKQPHMSKVQRCSTSLTFIASDEGYDDTEYPELESQCVFYPLSDNDDECMISKRDQAAVKIQAAWRGYSSRLKTGHLQFHLRPEQHVILSLVKLCDRFHRREMSTMNERLYQLEQRIREETAMRIAFEKAMEDMTVLMDQQQKVLYDRLEQEVRMRQTYEDKMNTTLTQIQPLENRITKEANARKNLEDMMTCVLDELQETKALQYKQTKEAADSKKEMQAKLDQALEEITTIKKQQLPTRPSVKASTVPRVTKTSYTSALSPATLSTASPTSITASARKSTLSGSTKTNTKHTPSPRKSVVPASKDTSRPLRSVVDSKQKRSIQSQPERPSVVPSRRPAGNATAPPSGRRPVLACK